MKKHHGSVNSKKLNTEILNNMKFMNHETQYQYEVIQQSLLIMTILLFKGSYEIILFTLMGLYLLVYRFVDQDCNQLWHTQKCNPTGFCNPIESCNPTEFCFVINKDYRPLIDC